MDGGLAPHPLSSRKTRARLCALGLLSAALLVTTGSRAGACPVADLDCVVEKTEDTVGEAQDKVDDATGTAEDTVEDTASDVGESVDKVTGDTSDDVGEAISDTVGNPGVARPGSKTDVSRPALGDGSGESVRGSKSKTEFRTKSAARKGSSARAPIAAPRRSAALAAARVRGLRTESAQPVAQANDPNDPAESGLAEAARRFVFPLILSVLVGIFLFLQSRVDRRDPKLALAPLDNEIVLFR